MIRWPLRIVVTLLFLACAMVWARSYRVGEKWVHQETTREGDTFTTQYRTIASGRGGFFFNRNTQRATPKNDFAVEDWKSRMHTKGWTYHRLNTFGYGSDAFPQTRGSTVWGFGHHTVEGSTGSVFSKADSYVFPYAAPTIALSILPMWWVFRFFVPRETQHNPLASQFGDND